MKKAIIISLLLVIFAGSAFAQLTFSGEAFVGIQIEKEYELGEKVTADHRKYHNPLFNFTAVAAKENYGIKLDVDFMATGAPFEARLNGIFGWADFLDNTIHLSMGKISDSKWISNLDPDKEEFFDRITGVRVEYKTPLPGLSGGVAFRTDGKNLVDVFQRTIFGASYVQAMFNAVISYDMGNNGQLLFAFNYTDFPDLTDAGIEILAENFATWDSDPVYGRGGSFQIREKVGYRVIRPLTVSLLMRQKIFAAKESKPELVFRPAASYRILPGLTGTLTLELNSDDSFDTSNLVITPCFEYMLKGTALIYVQYQLELEKMKEDNHKFGFGIDIKAF